MLGQERRQIRATLIGAPVRFQLVFGFVNAIRLTWDGGMMLCTPDVLPRPLVIRRQNEWEYTEKDGCLGRGSSSQPL
jgi:hypothetical protein